MNFKEVSEIFEQALYLSFLASIVWIGLLIAYGITKCMFMDYDKLLQILNALK